MLAMRRMARTIFRASRTFRTALRLLWTLAAFADARTGRSGQLPNGRAQSFNLTLLGVFLNLGFFECFESFFHFEQKRFKVSINLLHLFDGLANGGSGVVAATGDVGFAAFPLFRLGRFSLIQVFRNAGLELLGTFACFSLGGLRWFQGGFRGLCSGF